MFKSEYTITPGAMVKGLTVFVIAMFIAISIFVTNFFIVFAMQERNRARRVTDDAAISFFLGFIFALISSAGAVILFFQGWVLVPFGALCVVLTLWFLLLVTLALFDS